MTRKITQPATKASPTPGAKRTPDVGAVEHMDDEGCQLLADFFSVLAHPTRMRLFCYLGCGRHTISELAERLNITVQNASQQLRIMREKGVLTADREGQSVYLSIADSRIVDAVKLLRLVSVDKFQRRASAMVSPTLEQPALEPPP